MKYKAVLLEDLNARLKDTSTTRANLQSMIDASQAGLAA